MPPLTAASSSPIMTAANVTKTGSFIRRRLNNGATKQEAQLPKIDIVTVNISWSYSEGKLGICQGNCVFDDDVSDDAQCLYAKSSAAYL